MVPVQRYESAERLLADASNAAIFAADHSILLDPDEKLTKLAAIIKKEYPKKNGSQPDVTKCWPTPRRRLKLSSELKI